MRSLLGLASMYQAFQDYLGFAAVRQKAIDAYLPVREGAKVVDIGCGPGRIREFLPQNIEYLGYDVDENYIRHARQAYGDRGRFFCREFNEDELELCGGADIVMLNGVLHHMPDSVIEKTLINAGKALTPGGFIFTLDGCYRDGQSFIAKKLLDLDRGDFVRNEPEYRRLISPHFPALEIHVREDLSLIPYTFIIILGRKKAA